MDDSQPKKWGTRQRRPIEDMRPQFDAIMAHVRARVELQEGGCWYWTKWKNYLGYAEVYWKGRMWSVTRLVYAATHGPFDKDMDICHTCDNPGCCNPRHLFVASHAENMLDSINKGRHAETNRTECAHGHPFSGDNVYFKKTGKAGTGLARACRECDRIKGRKRWREKHPIAQRPRMP